MRTPNTDRRQNGFTLIEVMVVIAILAAVLAVGAPKMFNSGAGMRSSIRQLAVMTREIRNVARLNNVTARIVINMEEGKAHSFWVESASANLTLLSAEQEKELAQLTSSQRDDEKPKSLFQMEARVTKKPIELAKGLYFESVEYAAKPAVAAGTTAYVHFFSQGLAEDVAIHFTDRKTLNWTLTINPLTGRADVYERKVALKDLRAP